MVGMLQGGRAAYHGDVAGFRSGEGPSEGNVPVHSVKIFNHYQDGQEIIVEVPEDRFVTLPTQISDQSNPLPAFGNPNPA